MKDYEDVEKVEVPFDSDDQPTVEEFFAVDVDDDEMRKAIERGKFAKRFRKSVIDSIQETDFEKHWRKFEVPIPPDENGVREIVLDRDPSLVYTEGRELTSLDHEDKEE